MQQRDISNAKKQRVASFISSCIEDKREEDKGTLTCVLLSRSKPRLDSLFFLLWLSPPPPRSSGDRESPAPIDLPVKTRERHSLEENGGGLKDKEGVGHHKGKQS